MTRRNLFIGVFRASVAAVAAFFGHKAVPHIDYGYLEEYFSSPRWDYPIFKFGFTKYRDAMVNGNGDYVLGSNIAGPRSIAYYKLKGDQCECP